MEALIPICALLMPVMIVWLVLHYKERRRQHREVPGAVEASNAQLSAMAERMEQRIDALEQILDAESPGWRKKYHEHS